MPQFAPGDSKTAIAPITVRPTGLSAQAELFLGPNDTTKVATSGLKAFTSTGAQQNINLPVTMPTSPGAYHVYLDIYAGGMPLAGFIADEDVVIVSPIGNFVYSNEFFELRPWSEIVPVAGTASCYVVFRCTITNQGSERGIRTVSFYYQRYSTAYNRFDNPRLVKSFNLTLEPGQSYQFVFDPRINPTYHYEDGIEYWCNDDNLLVLAHGSFIWYVFLTDSAGGESAHPSAS